MMNDNKKRLWDNYEDALFALVMNDFAEIEGEKLRVENERLKQDLSIQVPKAFDQKCLKLIRAEYARSQRTQLMRSAKKVFTRFAVVAAILALLGISVCAVFPSVRRAFLNAAIEITDRATIFTFTDRVESDAPPSSQVNSETPITFGNYQLTWLPEGYEEVETTFNGKYQTVTYANADVSNEFIMLTLFTQSGPVLNVDTEDAQIENISVNGNTAMLVTKGNSIKVLWTDEKTGVFLCVLARGVSETATLSFVNGLIPLDQ